MTHAENTQLIAIEGLYEAARRAHSGTSFSPDERARMVVEDYTAQLNSDLNGIPEHQRNRYFAEYKKHLFAWLAAKSQIVSTMIAGPSNFPVRQMAKRNQTEDRRYKEFTDWRERALTAIRKEVERNKPEEVKTNESWERLRKQIISSAATIIGIDTGEVRGYTRELFVSSICNKVKTAAKSGNTELVKRALDLIKELNTKGPKPVITERNAIFKLDQVAEGMREINHDRANAQSKYMQFGTTEVVYNFKEDRIQLFFDGKPDATVISNLKKNAFRWSPSNVAWQRQLTNAGIYAASQVLGVALPDMNA